MDEDYLVHYGVLGMKWGVRKDKRYKYTSMRTKRLTKKAAKATEKGKKNAGKINEKLKWSKQTDKNLLAYAKKTSVGKALAQNILLGPGGAKSYATMRASGVSRGKAVTSQILTKAAGMVVGATLGYFGGKYVGKAVSQFMKTTPAQEIAAYNKLVKNEVDRLLIRASIYKKPDKTLSINPNWFNLIPDFKPKNPEVIWDIGPDMIKKGHFAGIYKSAPKVKSLSGTELNLIEQVAGERAMKRLPQAVDRLNKAATANAMLKGGKIGSKVGQVATPYAVGTRITPENTKASKKKKTKKK